MCTRYTLTDAAAAVAALYAELVASLAEAALAGPRYNIALTQRLPVITRREGRPVLGAMTFGLRPPPRGPGEKPLLLANARAETLLDRPAFREAARHRRCLVPADGFYEWEKLGRVRLPHYFTLRDRRPFFFAGIWEPAAGDSPAAFGIVTTTPNSLLAPIHDRMPVLLGPRTGPEWLGDEPLPRDRVEQLCRPLPADLMTGHRVDPRVNSVRYEAPDCIKAVDQTPDATGESSRNRQDGPPFQGELFA